MKLETIEILMDNGDEIKWTLELWDDYKYDGKFFIIMKNNCCVGFYNLDRVVSIIIK